MWMTLLLSVSLTAAPRLDEKLVGTWLAGNAPFVTLNANGTGTMDEGKVKWTADGRTLTVADEDDGVDTLAYSLSGDTLTLHMGGVPISLTRAGQGVRVQKQGPLSAKVAKGTPVAEEDTDRAAPQAQAPRGAGNDQLSQLLLSSAWCSFRYHKNTGTSSSTRYQFYRDGTWSTGGRTETYNSGSAGTVAGQYDSSNRGRWESRGGQLFMATPDSPTLQPVGGFSVTRNSNGSPIINADGREFSLCN